MSPTLKRTLGIIAVVTVVAAIAAPKLLPLFRSPPAAGAKTKAAGPTPRDGAGGVSLRVNTVKLAAVPMDETITATGSLRADEGVELQPETNGKIVSINFTEGARVRRGDLLLKLNDAELRATLQRSTYRLELAQIKERRFAVLLESSSINQQNYDDALSELSVQRAEVALVEAQIAKTEIRAPFDGVIGLRFVSEGAFVTPTTRVATLQRYDQVKLDFSIPEKYALRIRIGSPVTFVVDGSDRKYTGEVYAIDPRIDAGTRTVLLRAVSPNPDNRLLPGTFANVSFTLSRVADALLVPSAAVIPGLTEKNVFVVQEGRAVRRAVQTGIRTETSVQILEGLAPGDVVITSGVQQLRPGMSVQFSAAEGESLAAKKRSTKETEGGKAASKRTVPAS
jgi:membrane fusion protein (multidrug efflux system)